MNPSPKITSSSYFDPTSQEWVTTIVIRQEALSVKVTDFKVPSKSSVGALTTEQLSFLKPSVNGSNNFSWSPGHSKEWKPEKVQISQLQSLNLKPLSSSDLQEALKPIPPISTSELEKYFNIKPLYHNI